MVETPSKVNQNNSIITTSNPIITSNEPIISKPNIPMLTSTKFIQNKTTKLSSKERAVEWLKCKTNIFYFIFNYVTIPEIGGILKYESNMMHDKIKKTVKSVVKYHKGPRTPAIILNANKTFAFENLQKIKFIHENLPKFLAIPLKYKGDRKTYLEYTHGSMVRVFYPSSTTSADTLARSLTSPILYIDEGALKLIYISNK